MSNKFSFKGILTENGWIENAEVSLDENGLIATIESKDSITGLINGYALPGFQNAHSHAFQYAMAGLAEYHGGASIPDDFWSWRNAMYNLALTLSPDDLEAIATMLYTEMLKHGYTSVAEFHYLHHDPNGKHYQNPAELGSRLIAAAKNAGIRITLVPMFYQQGGFGLAPEKKQRRFISSNIDAYYQLLEASKKECLHYHQSSTAVGIHSLRAVKPDDVIQFCSDLDEHTPFHIHVSEQLKEIADAESFLGARPVQWLLDNCPVNECYHLVHATHLTDNEVVGIAQSQANVVICPSTEGNLGDGLFRFRDYKEVGGRWSIGTDSHISLNPFEELRFLDYGQRLITHKRDTFHLENQGNSGFNALSSAWKNGRKAMGAQQIEFFQIGHPLDAVVMDGSTPLVASSSSKNLCNTIVYSSDATHILGTIVNGEWVIENGRHKHQDKFVDGFVGTLRTLGNRL